MEKVSVHLAHPTPHTQAPPETRAKRARFDFALLEAPPLTWTELAWVMGLLTVVAVALYGGYISDGGFYSDDWSLAAGIENPRAYGHDSVFGFVLDQADSRVTAAAYWFASHELFGLHAKAYLAVAVGLGVVLAGATYALLRELGLERVLALAVVLLMLAFPPADAVRVWATPALSQLSLAAWSVGALLALRAFAASGRRRTALHAGSFSLYVFGLSITELVVPFLILVSPLLYLTVAPWRTAARRWLVDAALAVAGAALAAWLTTDAPEHRIRGLADWWTRGKVFADQGVTVFSRAIAPYVYGVRWAVLLAAVAIAAGAGILALSKRSPGARVMRRWLATAGIALVAIVAGWAVYVPADPYYYPLQQGLASRVNIGIAAPLAVLLVALSVLGALVLFHWAADVRRVALTAAVAYGALLLAAFTQDLRTDLRTWEYSAREQYRAIGTIKNAVPNPPDGTKFFVFGTGGVVTPGLPVFTHVWEITGALRAIYDSGDVAGVPIFAGRGVLCPPHGVVASVVGTPEVLLEAPYGSAVLVDTATGRTATVGSTKECMRVAPTFVPGPYTVPGAPPPPSSQ
jgi:hypothetical protein